jgi:hypothetical protein
MFKENYGEAVVLLKHGILKRQNHRGIFALTPNDSQSRIIKKQISPSSLYVPAYVRSASHPLRLEH